MGEWFLFWESFRAVWAISDSECILCQTKGILHLVIPFTNAAFMANHQS